MCNNYKMMEKMLKGYLYDRYQKVGDLYDNFNENSIRQLFRSVNTGEDSIEREMSYIKEDISYFKQRKDIFSEDEMEKILSIDDKLGMYIEDQKYAKKARKERLEKYIKEIKSGEIKDIISLIKEDDIYYLDCLKRYDSYRSYIVYELGSIIFKKWENEKFRLEKNESIKIVDLTNLEFVLFIHAIGVNPECAIKNSKDCNIISTSMITNDKYDLFLNREYGFIYDANKDNIILISSGDCNANEMPLDDHYPGIFTEYLSANTYLSYNYSNMHRVCLIEQLKIYKSNEKYNEIVLINNKETKPIGVVVKKNASETNRENAEDLAEKMGLVLYEIL